MDALSTKAHRARWRLAGIAAASVGVLGAAGLLAVNLLGPGSAPPTSSSAASSGPSGTSLSSAPAAEHMTPARAKPLVLIASGQQKDGAPLGFPDNGVGAVSAAVAYWEEFAFLDDSLARKQLQVLVSPDSPQTIDRLVSAVRKTRGAVGLPPSGPAPADITFSTVVNAVRAKSLVQGGSVVQVWLQYDRYAIKAEGGGDDDPLKGESTDVIVKWQDGQWRITEEAKYHKLRTFPVAYDPNSVPARADGWMRVDHAN